MSIGIGLFPESSDVSISVGSLLPLVGDSVLFVSPRLNVGSGSDRLDNAALEVTKV